MTNKIICIVADVSMGWALEVGSKLGIKGVFFWSSSAIIRAASTYSLVLGKFYVESIII